MRWLCVLLGFLTGKVKVRCDACANLDAAGACYGHPMPAAVIHRDIACGFWKPRQKPAVGGE